MTKRVGGKMPVLAGAGLLAMAIAMPAQAEEAADASASEMEITVYGRHAGYDVHSASSPTKTETQLIDVPQAITVLNRTQLNDQAVDSLNDALRYVPGVVLGQGEGHRDQVTLRGQNSTADFFLDGLRDDAQYYRPLYNTERVEVLKGANAMIFGRGGGGGVINRVSKTASLDKTFGAASASMGSWGEWMVSGDANVVVADAVAVRINATHEDFANHRDSYDGHFTGIAPSLGADLGDATRLMLAYEYAEDRRITDRGVPSVRPVAGAPGRPMSGVYRTFFGTSDTNSSSVDAHIVRARLDHAFSDSLSVNLQGQFAHYDKFYSNIYPRAATATTVDFEGYLNATERENWIVQGNLVWHGKTGFMRHTLLAGFEASQQDTEDSRRLARFGAGGTATSGALPITRPMAFPAIAFGPGSRGSVSRGKVLSAYIQDQVELGDHLQVVAGVRHDDFRIRSLNTINGFAARRSDSKW